MAAKNLSQRRMNQVRAGVIPPQFLQMLPYVFAIIVLVQVTRGAEAPRALARPYEREARD